MAIHRQAFIGAGANLGDRFATLCHALTRLRRAKGITHLESSDVYESEPVGLAEQPRFLNLVIGIETTLTPEALLAELQSIEFEFGRTREVHWGPRTLDLDLLIHEGESRSTPELALPHPRLFERAFVTVPLLQLLVRPRFARGTWKELRGKLSTISFPGTPVWKYESALVDVATGLEAIAFLHDLKAQGVQPGLDRMRTFASVLGNPQDRVPVIHVAGTNGKGSVAAMLEAILRAAGWRTGLYTSPHLIRLGERVQVNRQPLTFAEWVGYVRELRPLVEARIAANGAEARLSYFEFMTALAFQHFMRCECDVAIVEVGMGGLLDATNIVSPEVSVITSIGHDHAEFLGKTLEAIATHKAGVIKHERPVVMGRLPPQAERVVQATAAAMHAALTSVRREFGDDVTRYPRTRLDGDYQRLNAATATLAARTLGPQWRIDVACIQRGLNAVEWPGRWHRLNSSGRTVVVDASHNEEGAASLDRNLNELVRETGRAPVVVIGVLGAVRAKPLLEVVCRHARVLHLVMPRQSRACSHAELEALVPSGFRHPVLRSTVESVFPSSGQCMTSEPLDTPVVVTGSLYLAGEVLARMNPQLSPLEVDLQDF